MVARERHIVLVLIYAAARAFLLLRYRDLSAANYTFMRPSTLRSSGSSVFLPPRPSSLSPSLSHISLFFPSLPFFCLSLLYARRLFLNIRALRQHTAKEPMRGKYSLLFLYLVVLAYSHSPKFRGMSAKTRARHVCVCMCISERRI